jgi:hypothetical protein
MAINNAATELAASHDTFTKVWKLPFRGEKNLTCDFRAD